jgi:glycosyltransferase involved in cell wall biosynthesis
VIDARKEHHEVVVAMSTYNDTERAVAAVRSIFRSKTRAQVSAVVVDDGSDGKTVEALSALTTEYPNFFFLPRPHRERGYARYEAIEEALQKSPEFMLFMDADMELEPDAIEKCMEAVQQSGAGAVLIREIPHSSSQNFATKVKVFERFIVNNSQSQISSDSIEAARFWTVEAWKQSGGLNPAQIAFEEIQPTIRYMKSGGKVVRQRAARMKHDEKDVSFQNLFDKKGYYFGAMHKTGSSEENGFMEMLKRWYPFRSVYYESQNIKQYVKHPILTTGMVGMYAGLTLVAAKNLGSEMLKNTK